MGGSSSQPHTKQLMSHIHSFLTKDMYSSQYSDSFHHTASFQHNARDDSPVEVTAPPPNLKLTKERQKRTAQNEGAPRSTAWTNEEEIELCKGWVHVSKNSFVGNTKREAGFWTEVLRYLENETKAPGLRIYDMASGAGDEDYFAMSLLDYEVKHGMSFTLRHGWEVLRKILKLMDTEVPNFAGNQQASKRCWSMLVS
nr:hypothetical protein [Tanacetum cinerariifolium]